MPIAKTAKNSTQPDINIMVVSHERALFGYTDRDSMTVVPGLLSRIDDAHKDIAIVKQDMVGVKESLKDVPEMVSVVKYIKKWGAWGTLAIVMGLVSIILHQYNLLPGIVTLLAPH